MPSPGGEGLARAGQVPGERRRVGRAEESQLARAGHLPLRGQAAAEEEEGGPRDLQGLPAGGLQHLPARGA